MGNGGVKQLQLSYIADGKAKWYNQYGKPLIIYKLWVWDFQIQGTMYEIDKWQNNSV